MADFTLERPNVFPDGTEVGAYAASDWPTPIPPTGEPAGTATDTATVASDTATFTGLTEGTAYWAVGEVGETYRYISFFVPKPSDAVARSEVVGVATYDAEAEEWGRRPEGFTSVLWISAVHGAPDPEEAEDFDQKVEPGE